MRQGVWTDRVNMIAGHNEEFETGVHSFRLGENHLADLTQEEIVAMMNGLSLDFGESGDRSEVTEDQIRDLPDTVDWRQKVLNLLNCRSLLNSSPRTKISLMSRAT